MLAIGLRRCGCLLVFLAGCDLLPPPPPPKLRTAPPVSATPVRHPKDDDDEAAAPRTANAAPDRFQAKFETTKGTFVVDVHRDWSPHGADRFYELVNYGFYDNCKFFRQARDKNLEKFVVQWGLNGNPALNSEYRDKLIRDDRVKHSNRRGTITYAKGGPNTRTTQLFINFSDKNTWLDAEGFSPFGEVIEGMDEVVDQLNDEYAERPDQTQIQQRGNAYLDENFPNLDYIIKAIIVVGEPRKTTPDPKPAEVAPDQPTDAAAPANAGQ